MARAVSNTGKVPKGSRGVPPQRVLLASERSERDTLSRSSMENAIRIYIYIYMYRYVRHTLVARSCGYVMWEELSVSHF